jgi:hypothetical protein
MPSIQDLVMRLVTGRTAPQMFDTAALGNSPLPWDERHPDHSVHALASKLATQRLGSGPAFILGTGKELAQGMFAPLHGESMIGEHGFSGDDMRANLVGIIAGMNDRNRGRVERGQSFMDRFLPRLIGPSR